MSIGRTIKFLRESAKLKQVDLADTLGVSPNYISMIENDRREPSLSILRKVSEKLDVPLALIFLESRLEELSEDPIRREISHKIMDLMFEIERVRLQEYHAQDEP